MSRVVAGPLAWAFAVNSNDYCSDRLHLKKRHERSSWLSLLNLHPAGTTAFLSPHIIFFLPLIVFRNSHAFRHYFLFSLFPPSLSSCDNKLHFLQTFAPSDISVYIPLFEAVFLFFFLLPARLTAVVLKKSKKGYQESNKRQPGIYLSVLVNPTSHSFFLNAKAQIFATEVAKSFLKSPLFLPPRSNLLSLFWSCYHGSVCSLAFTFCPLTWVSSLFASEIIHAAHYLYIYSI